MQTDTNIPALLSNNVTHQWHQWWKAKSFAFPLNMVGKKFICMRQGTCRLSLFRDLFLDSQVFYNNNWRLLFTARQWCSMNACIMSLANVIRYVNPIKTLSSLFFIINVQKFVFPSPYFRNLSSFSSAVAMLLQL